MMNDPENSATGNAPAEKPRESISKSIERDVFVIVWLVVGLVVTLLLFAETLSASGSARWAWAGAALVYLTLQAILESWALERWFPAHSEQNFKWIVLLPILAIVWLIMQLIVSSSFQLS